MAKKNRIITSSIAARNFLAAFLHNEAIGGILLMICAVVALMCANIQHLGFLHELWDTNVGINIGSFSLEMSLELWINDFLM